MSEIDWGEAPEWATKHGYAGLDRHQVWMDDCKYTYCDGRQDGMVFDFGRGLVSRSIQDIDSITERPSPAWSGDEKHETCGELQLEALKFRVLGGGIQIIGTRAPGIQCAWFMEWKSAVKLTEWLMQEIDRCTSHELRTPSPETLTATAWSGDGLPPVGAVCEVNDARINNWRAVDGVVAHVSLSDRDVAVFRIGDYIAYSPADRFRPIRTHEQIAADEREAAINRACADIDKLVAAYNMSIDCSAAIRATIEALYDAGYRKP